MAVLTDDRLEKKLSKNLEKLQDLKESVEHEG